MISAEKFVHEHNKKELGKRLKAARVENGMFQSDIAVIFSCGQSQVSNWERGIKIPSRQTLKKYYQFQLVDKSEYLQIQNLHTKIIARSSNHIKARAER